MQAAGSMKLMPSEGWRTHGGRLKCIYSKVSKFVNGEDELAREMRRRQEKVKVFPLGFLLPGTQQESVTHRMLKGLPANLQIGRLEYDSPPLESLWELTKEMLDDKGQSLEVVLC